MYLDNISNRSRVTLIVGTTLFYVLSISLSFMAYKRVIFPEDICNMSRKYIIDIMPTEAVFSLLWSLIYIWQLAWLLYACVCAFRRTSDGTPLLERVDFLPPAVFVSFLLSKIACDIWLFTWAYEHIALSGFLLAFSTVAAQLALIFSLTSLENRKAELYQNDLHKDVHITRLLVHNGLALFTTWLSIATVLTFTIFLKYNTKMDELSAGTTGLSILLLFVITYFLFENFFFRRYHLWLITPWFAFLATYIGTINGNWVDMKPTRNNVFTVALLIVSAVFAGIKLLNMLVDKMCGAREEDRDRYQIPTTRTDPSYTPVQTRIGT